MPEKGICHFVCGWFGRIAFHDPGAAASGKINGGAEQLRRDAFPAVTPFHKKTRDGPDRLIVNRLQYPRGIQCDIHASRSNSTPADNLFAGIGEYSRLPATPHDLS